MTLVQERPAGIIRRAGTPRRTHSRAAPWLLPLVAVAIQAWFVLIADRTSPSVSLWLVTVPGRTALPLIGLLGTAAAVGFANARGKVRADPVTLSITALLSLSIAFPIAHLPHDRLVGYGFVAAAVGLTASALWQRAVPDRLPGALTGVVLLVVLLVVSLRSPDAGALQQLLLIACVAVPMYLLPQLQGRDRLADLTLVILTLAATQSLLALIEPFAWPHHLWAGAPTVDLGGGVSRPLVNTVLPGLERSQATLGHPLPLGLLLVVAIALLLRVRTDLPRVARTGLFTLFLAGVVVAGDRNALLLALALLVWGGRLRALRVLGGGIALLLGVVVLVQVGVLSRTFFDQLLQSGSYLHRVQALHLVGELAYTQPLPHVFFGNGFASTPRMFALGLLQNDGLEVVDNQYVLTLSQGGLVCLTALVALTGRAIATCPRALRPAAVSVALVMLIFDYMLWPSATALLFLIIGLSVRSGGKARGGRREADTG